MNEYEQRLAQMEEVFAITGAASLVLAIILMFLMVTFFSEKPRKLNGELQRRANNLIAFASSGGTAQSVVG